jgi:hypothetical protein
MTKTRSMLLAALLVTGACHSPSGPDPVVLGRPFELRVGETAVLSPEGLQVSFRDVGDSRCPSSVFCPWEGDAAVSIAAQASERHADLVLHTTLDPAAAQFLQYRIRLATLRPYPRDPGPIDPKDYVATLVVSLEE